MVAVELPVGTHVVAVSGGVDSVALLHLLAELRRNNPGSYRFIVAHFDHGIRPDSAEDRRFVQSLARHYGLPFVYERVELGAGASETAARRARYQFLRAAQRSSGAHSIITAHHQDDVIETALLNMLRGTKGRGLHSLSSTTTLQRPLLGFSKKQLMKYAQANGLVWREDSTNADEAIIRNYVRSRVVAPLGVTHRSQLLKHIERARVLNAEIDLHITNYLHLQPGLDALNRPSFIELPHAVSREVLATWLRRRTKQVELNKKLVERLVVAAKIARSGSQTDIAGGYRLEFSPQTITLVSIHDAPAEV